MQQAAGADYVSKSVVVKRRRDASGALIGHLSLCRENSKVACMVLPIYARKTAPRATTRPPKETMLAAAPLDSGGGVPLAPPAEAVDEGLEPEPEPEPEAEAEAEPLEGAGVVKTGTTGEV